MESREDACRSSRKKLLYATPLKHIWKQHYMGWKLRWPVCCVRFTCDKVLTPMLSAAVLDFPLKFDLRGVVRFGYIMQPCLSLRVIYRSWMVTIRQCSALEGPPTYHVVTTVDVQFNKVLRTATRRLLCSRSHGKRGKGTKTYKLSSIPFSRPLLHINSTGTDTDNFVCVSLDLSM